MWYVEEILRFSQDDRRAKMIEKKENPMVILRRLKSRRRILFFVENVKNMRE